MRVRSALLRRLAGRRLSSEHAGWAEIHEAVLRVIVSPPAGAPALCHHGLSGYQPLSLVPNPDGAVACTAKRFHKWRSPPIELANTTKSVTGSTKRDHRSGSDGLSGADSRQAMVDIEIKQIQTQKAHNQYFGQKGIAPA